MIIISITSFYSKFERFAVHYIFIRNGSIQRFEIMFSLFEFNKRFLLSHNFNLTIIISTHSKTVESLLQTVKLINQFSIFIELNFAILINFCRFHASLWSLYPHTNSNRITNWIRFSFCNAFILIYYTPIYIFIG